MLVAIVRPNPDIDPDFFGLTLYRLESHFEGLSTGATGQTELSRDAVGNTSIIVAPDIQKNFGEEIRPLRQHAGLLGVRNQNLRQTRDLLLPKLISGELDVEELDIAVA